MQLSTPIGNICIFIDDKKINYEYEHVELDLTCRDVAGRYRIQISFVPDGQIHRISCRLQDYQASDQDEIETGENLELKSFYKGNVKLSIGMEGDIGYIDGKRISGYDYDNEYEKDGVSYSILSDTKTQKYVFGISWIENYTVENEVQTWYGADPTFFHIS